MLVEELRLAAHLVVLKLPVAMPGEIAHADLKVRGSDLHEVHQVGLLLLHPPECQDQLLHLLLGERATLAHCSIPSLFSDILGSSSTRKVVNTHYLPARAEETLIQAPSTNSRLGSGVGFATERRENRPRSSPISLQVGHCPSSREQLLLEPLTGACVV